MPSRRSEVWRLHAAFPKNVPGPPLIPSRDPPASILGIDPAAATCIRDDLAAGRGRRAPHPPSLGLAMKKTTPDTGIHGPYWLRAHRDWRFWAVLVLMLLGIVTYVMTMDLSWRPQPPSAELRP